MDTLPRNPQVDVERRRFMIGAAGLSFGFVLPATLLGSGAARAAAVRDAVLSPWVTISTDGSIAIMSPATEMGQGSLTSLPLILAEELDADWSKVRIVPAPPIEKIYGNPGFNGLMYTAGSFSVNGYYDALRTFGAQVRMVLLDNAARRLDVPFEELSTRPSVVLHEKSGQSLSYGEIAEFAEVPARAPDVKPGQLTQTRDFRLIGKDVMRVELPTKVDGSAQYSIDVQVPGMVYAAVLRSPVEGGAPEKVDDAEARATEGVQQVIRLPYGVAVIAESPWAAFTAKNALKVGWKRNGKAWNHSSEKAMEQFAAIARDFSKPGTTWEKQGDAPAAMRQAAQTFEGEYACDYAYHAQMEPLNSVAAVAADGQSVEIWCGTQSQSMAVAAVAKALGIAENRVKFNGMLMGGGFGRRGHRDEEFVVESVVLSKEVKRPVKMMWTREDDIRNGRFRPLYVQRIRAGLDASGKLIAWQHRVVCDQVLAYQDPVRYRLFKGNDGIAMRGIELRTYAIPNRLGEGVLQDTGVRTSSLRGIGVGPTKFAIEVFLDELAAKRGIDPVALRLELLRDSPRARAVVERVAQMADWGRRRDDRGLGFAYIDYTGSQLAGIAEVSVERPSGRINVHNFWCVMDCGIAVQPDNVIAQTESSTIYGLGLALTERISFSGGAIEQSNFTDYAVMRMRDVPELHTELIRTDNHPTGAGQMSTPLVAPAISNALFQLTGVRVRRTPMTPEVVQVAFAEQGKTL
ncbi:MAG TPA: molybdopterin cofactor-binding domain-containing protein [Burkholderiales bacterium]|nr:molybdopterin cofactor-binding domain-containing protein [Burkholderiales bacterium]